MKKIETMSVPIMTEEKLNKCEKLFSKNDNIFAGVAIILHNQEIINEKLNKLLCSQTKYKN